jgi:hypothetical protein
MNFSDLYSLSLHRLVAEKLLQDPEKVLKIARENLSRWLASEGFAAGPERRALLEWVDILDNSSPKEIFKILTEESDEGQRLRSSTPFAGVLSREEREMIWSECAETGLV